MTTVLHFIAIVIEVYVIVLIVYALSSWIPAEPGSVVRRVSTLLGAVCEPVLRPVRRLVPPVRAGGAAIDLSVLIVIVVLQVLAAVVR